MCAYENDDNNNGFTLIEVLIAMTVFSIGLLSVITMQTTGVTGNARAFYMSEATNLAAERVEILLGEDYNLLVDGLGTNVGAAGFNDEGVTAGTVADGSDVDPLVSYRIYWNVAENQPVVNCKTVRVIVTHPQLQPPVSIDFIKVKDL